MSIRKLLSLDEMSRECERWRKHGRRVVWTNGCFDLLHAGHVRALTAARKQGDVLVVGLNSDRSIRGLGKGDDRPICNQRDRAEVLSGLSCVDGLVFFDGKNCANEIRAVRPSVWTKSGDYTIESLDPDERRALEECGGEVVITPLIPGISTTLLVDKIRRLDPEKIVSAVCVFVRDEQGRLLMVATRYADGVQWSLPGGGQKHGESLWEAARREAFEETGVEVEVGRHMGMIERIERRWALHVLVHVFEGRVEGRALPKGDYYSSPDEFVEGVAWFDRERLRREPRVVKGRRLWIQFGDKPERWPPYSLLQPGEE